LQFNVFLLDTLKHTNQLCIFQPHNDPRARTDIVNATFS